MTDQQGATETGRRINARLVASAIAAVAMVLFVVQNTESVQVRFLWFEGGFPLFLLLLITIALTLILALGATWLMRRRGSGS
ncbi:MAG: lipopolysaccharide assembly protein LapA domain-containing protein [Acidimicrobiales bacterium]